MWKYVLKRLGYMVIVFLIITFLMYMLFNLIPSDPAAAVVEPLRDKVDAVTFEELYQAQREKMGLNDPLMIRYLVGSSKPSLVQASCFRKYFQAHFDHAL